MMSEMKRVYLEDSAQFTLIHGAAITVRKGESYQATIDWGSTVELAGGKGDPALFDGVFIGEFTEWKGDVPVVHQVYVKDDRTPGDFLFYYYVKATPVRKTYLRDGSELIVQWKANAPVTHSGSTRLDINELLTFSDENQAHTEVGNDGPSVGKVTIDEKAYDVYVEEVDGVRRIYCYLD